MNSGMFFSSTSLIHASIKPEALPNVGNRVISSRSSCFFCRIIFWVILEMYIYALLIQHILCAHLYEPHPLLYLIISSHETDQNEFQHKEKVFFKPLIKLGGKSMLASVICSGRADFKHAALYFSNHFSIFSFCYMECFSRIQINP